MIPTPFSRMWIGISLAMFMWNVLSYPILVLHRYQVRKQLCEARAAAGELPLVTFKIPGDFTGEELLSDGILYDVVRMEKNADHTTTLYCVEDLEEMNILALMNQNSDEEEDDPDPVKRDTKFFDPLIAPQLAQVCRERENNLYRYREPLSDHISEIPSPPPQMA